MKKPKPNHRASQPIDQFVGARIRMARVSANMSQEALGGILGVSFQQVQKYEKGTNRVSAGRLLQIASALGEPVQWFLDEPTTNTGKMQDSVMAQMLSTARGRELAELYIRAADPAKAQALSLLRTFEQLVA